MKIESIEITQFRNYNHLQIQFPKKITIFIGDNAQGKTSILEAIYVLALTKSHRVQKDSNMIQNNTDYAKIQALINLKEKDIELDIVISKAGKKAKYNQIELDKLSDYLGYLNVVMFAPEDLELIKGNPKTRRQFLDLEIGQISKEYLYNLQNYRKIMKQRNDLLKTMQRQDKKDYMLLDVITDQLVAYQVRIQNQRSIFIEKINTYAQKHYKILSSSNDVLKLEYKPSLQHNFKEEYSSKYQYDIITGTTNLGVHRDEIEFSLNNYPIKAQGSQGEQRTAVLAVKLALIDFIYSYKKEYPVLLLDDVLSELDYTRQNNLLHYIENGIQVFITSTSMQEIDLSRMKEYQVYKINQGIMKESDTNE
jgi:DNA replication and repair protein RecF